MPDLTKAEYEQYLTDKTLESFRKVRGTATVDDVCLNEYIYTKEYGICVAKEIDGVEYGQEFRRTPYADFANKTMTVTELEKLDADVDSADKNIDLRDQAEQLIRSERNGR